MPGSMHICYERGTANSIWGTSEEFCIGNDRERSKMFICWRMQDHSSDHPVITTLGRVWNAKNDANSDLMRFWDRHNLTNELEFSSIYPLRKHWRGNSTNVSCSKSGNFLQIANTIQLDLDPSSAAYFLCNWVDFSDPQFPCLCTPPS